MVEKLTYMAEKLTKYGGNRKGWPCSVSTLLSSPIIFCKTAHGSSDERLF